MSKPFAKDGGYIEINLYNYDEYDVSQLNEWGIWAVSELERLKAINAELLAACESIIMNSNWWSGEEYCSGPNDHRVLYSHDFSKLKAAIEKAKGGEGWTT